MYEFLLSNLLTMFTVGVGLYMYHSYVEYKKQQYYEHLQYKFNKVMKTVSKMLFKYLSQYHEMKTANNLETIKDLLIQMTENNNGQIGNNLHTIKDLMNEFNETTKNKNMGFDLSSCLKPVADSFLQSLTKNNSNAPDLGAYVCKLNKLYDDQCSPCPGSDNKSKSKYHKHKQCDDTDEESGESCGVKLTI